MRGARKAWLDQAEKRKAEKICATGAMPMITPLLGVRVRVRIEGRVERKGQHQVWRGG